MPSSPITKTIDNVPDNHRDLEKIVIPHEETAHYYRVWFEGGSPIERPMSWLMCCYIDDNPNIEDNWHNVEELDFKHRCVIGMIRDFLDIDFEH